MAAESVAEVIRKRNKNRIGPGKLERIIEDEGATFRRRATVTSLFSSLPMNQYSVARRSNFSDQDLSV